MDRLEAVGFVGQLWLVKGSKVPRSTAFLLLSATLKVPNQEGRAETLFTSLGSRNKHPPQHVLAPGMETVSTIRSRGGCFPELTQCWQCHPHLQWSLDRTRLSWYQNSILGPPLVEFGLFMMPWLPKSLEGTQKGEAKKRQASISRQHTDSSVLYPNIIIGYSLPGPVPSGPHKPLNNDSCFLIQHLPYSRQWCNHFI